MGVLLSQVTLITKSVIISAIQSVLKSPCLLQDCHISILAITEKES